jgi:hypothetical protein
MCTPIALAVFAAVTMLDFLPFPAEGGRFMKQMIVILI